MDIERAADLTSESRAKHAKAKARGLTCTLIIEAISSEKTWNEIKDLLQTQNYAMQTFTLTPHVSVDIQQCEKESLAAYFHQLKMEAKQCNFSHMMLSLLGFFVKGLKNANSLAAHIYEKDPQTLTDAITEVEKL